MNIQEIMQRIQQNIGNNVSENDLPSGMNTDQFASAASESVISTLQGQAGNGDLASLKEMFSGSDTSSDHPTIAEMSPNLINQLSNKFGIDGNTASALVAKILPGIMNTFNSKATDGSFDFQKIIGQFTGNDNIANTVQNLFDNNSSKGQGGGILSIIKKLFGK